MISFGVAIVVVGMGGPTVAGDAVYERAPELFRREGKITIRQWISFTLLWPMAVPMFPQMFSRFYIARDEGALRTSAWLYPLVVALLFVAPVLLGVLGQVEFPGLVGKEADFIVARLLDNHAPLWLAATILTGAIAAFMSTADSQLLAMSSIITRDVVKHLHPGLTARHEFAVGRWSILLLAAVGLWFAYDPPGTIFDIVKLAFAGLAVLFPTTVAVVWRPGVSARACIASIIVGETLVMWTLVSEQPLPAWFTLGFHPSIPIVGSAAIVLLLGERLKTTTRSTSATG